MLSGTPDYEAKQDALVLEANAIYEMTTTPMSIKEDLSIKIYLYVYQHAKLHIAVFLIRLPGSLFRKEAMAPDLHEYRLFLPACASAWTGMHSWMIKSILRGPWQVASVWMLFTTHVCLRGSNDYGNPPCVFFIVWTISQRTHITLFNCSSHGTVEPFPYTKANVSNCKYITWSHWRIPLYCTTHLFKQYRHYDLKNTDIINL